MAYRTKGYRARSSRGSRRSNMSNRAAPRSSRVSRFKATRRTGGTQTVRVVIEQPGAGRLARPDLVLSPPPEKRKPF